jgi:hypothetical protein
VTGGVAVDLERVGRGRLVALDDVELEARRAGVDD